MVDPCYTLTMDGCSVAVVPSLKCHRSSVSCPFVVAFVWDFWLFSFTFCCGGLNVSSRELLFQVSYWVFVDRGSSSTKSEPQTRDARAVFSLAHIIESASITASLFSHCPPSCFYWPFRPNLSPPPSIQLVYCQRPHLPDALKKGSVNWSCACCKCPL